MDKFFKPLYILLIAFFCMSNLHAQKQDHIQGEVIVEVRNDNGLKSLLKDLSSNATVRSSMAARKIMSEPMNLWVLNIDPNEVNELTFLNDVIKNNHTLLAQQNHLTQLRLIPNDPRFSDQWQYINNGQSGGVVGADIDMDLAWNFTTGGLTTDGDTIVVCVIDDGMNINHPDVGNNIWMNHQEIAGNNIDDDSNGYVDDVRGWDAYNDNDNVTIDGSHGTSVAGIVGAKGNNGTGVAGVNWDVKLMIVRGGSPESTALAAYAYPYTMRKMYNETNGNKGAFVVGTNSSWGVDFGQPEDAPIWCDFYNMLGEVGILNFGATINGNTNVDVIGDLPTGCESKYLVAVTNMDHLDEKVNSAGFGRRSIDLGAFGEDTYTITLNSYGNFGGTSGATPHVAGTAALLYSADCPDFISLAKSNPAKAALVIKDCILHGVDPNISLQNITTTGGRLNALNSIQNLLSTCGDCASALGGEIGELTDKTGILTWFDNGNTGNTSIRYKTIGSIDWIVVNNVESGYQLDGLSACSTYEYQTKTNCPGGPAATYTYSRIFKTRGCCEIPNVTDITIVGQIATIQWEDVFGASNFTVEWKNTDDTEWIRVELGENYEFIIEGLFPCEFFQVRIMSECASTNNESEFSEIFAVYRECIGCTREFCEFGQKLIVDEWIESVEIENVLFNQSGGNENGYGNYIGLFNIDLNIEEEYTLILTPGYTDSSFDDYFSVYIDYDQDGQFSEAENIFKNEQPTQAATSGTFIVPANAKNGVTRMRVIMRYNALNGPCDELDFEFGEIEEYCVNIIGNSDCPTSIEATATDSTETSLTFELTQNDLIDFYIIAIRDVGGSSQFNVITSQLNTIVVPDLSVCSEYEYSPGFTCEGQTFIEMETFKVFTVCDTTNVDDIDDLSLIISPNPSSGILNIDFMNPLQDKVKIELISSEGKIVLVRNIDPNGNPAITIDAFHLPSGIYFIKAASEEKYVVKKWVKY